MSNAIQKLVSTLPEWKTAEEVEEYLDNYGEMTTLEALILSWWKWVLNEYTKSELKVLAQLFGTLWSLGNGTNVCALCRKFGIEFVENIDCSRCPLNEIDSCNRYDSAWSETFEGNKQPLLDALEKLTLQEFANQLAEECTAACAAAFKGLIDE